MHAVSAVFGGGLVRQPEGVLQQVAGTGMLAVAAKLAAVWLRCKQGKRIDRAAAQFIDPIV
jgi:hypothetical protein